MTNAGAIFAEVYKRYFGDVYKFVYRRIRNKEIAEDITQDVFCAAWNDIDKFLKHPEPKGWLIVTAKNKLRELYRKLAHEAPETLKEIPEPAAEEADYGEIELDLTAFRIISREEWKLIKDYYLVGIKITELAEKYETTPNNMRVKLCRLKAKLRKKIDR